MTALTLCRSSLLPALVALLLAGCTTMESGGPQFQQMGTPSTSPGEQSQSVLRFADDADPSGIAEFVTITDSGTNTLFEEAMPSNGRITVRLPADGKLLISTGWSEGRRTQQELTIPMTETDLLAPRGDGSVTLMFDESTRQFKIAPIPVNLSIEDTAGEVLYWGWPDDDIKVDATDATMISLIRWSDGSTTRQQISLTEDEVFYDDYGEYVQLAWDDQVQQYKPKTSSRARLLSRLSAAFIELQAGRFGDSPPTTGVVTGADKPLLKGSDEIDYRGLNLGFTFGKWGRLTPSLELGAVRGDDETSRELAGANSGWSYQGGDSPGGSPGLASTGGTRASLETDYAAQNFRLTLSDKFKLRAASQASLDYSLGLQRSVRDYRSEASLIAFPDITSTDRQKITGYDLSLGFGLRGVHTFRDKWALYGLVGLDAIYYRGKYEGDHRYDCNLCAPADQQFTQSTRDKNDGFTWGARLSARASYQVQTHSELYLGLDYHRQNEGPVLQTRVAPSDPEPHLDTGTLDWRSLRLGFNHRY